MRLAQNIIWLIAMFTHSSWVIRYSHISIYQVVVQIGAKKIRKVLIEFVSMVEQNGISLIWAFFINNYYLVTTLKYFTITVLPKRKWALLEQVYNSKIKSRQLVRKEFIYDFEMFFLLGFYCRPNNNMTSFFRAPFLMGHMGFSKQM